MPIEWAGLSENHATRFGEAQRVRCAVAGVAGAHALLTSAAPIRNTTLFGVPVWNSLTRASQVAAAPVTSAQPTSCPRSIACRSMERALAYRLH
jgi:hypothetical protein